GDGPHHYQLQAGELQPVPPSHGHAARAMTFLIGLPMLIVAAVLQSTALSHVHFFGGTVDLILLMTLSWTLAGDWQGGVMWGFIGGLCLDLLSGGPLGASS